jgi:hypothetical protein
MKSLALIALVVLSLWLSPSARAQDDLNSSGSSVAVPVHPCGGSDSGPVTGTALSDHDPRYGVEQFPRRCGALDWGLALSGGGIRSAAFSLGAMKALYDLGIMHDIDVISSVSGGGYASYWLYGTYAQDRGLKFGQAAFAGDNFERNIYQVKSRFIEPGTMAKIILDRKQGFGFYQSAIEASFGNCTVKNVKLGVINDDIAKGKAPVFVINSTAKLGRRDQSKELAFKRSNKVFELTPFYAGNPALGFRHWGNFEPRLGECFATSAFPLARERKTSSGELEAIHTETVPGVKLTLSDGGHSENLGALALIQRGIKNVIIVDAEADPAYRFGAYVKLKHILADQMIDLCIPSIERYIKLKSDPPCQEIGPLNGTEKRKRSKAFPNGVSIGTAIPPGEHAELRATKIYYIKMTDPEAALPELFERPVANSADATNRMVQKSSDDVLRYNHTLNHPRITENFHIWTVTHAFNLAGRGCRVLTFPFNTNKTKDICALLSYTFPQTTTMDQNWFRDQFNAFVGLGFLETLKLREYPTS